MFVNYITYNTEKRRVSMSKVRRLTKVRTLEILRLIMIVVVVFVALFPIIWVLLASFKSPGDLMRVPPVVFFQPTLSNYSDVASENFLFYFKNSLIVAISSVALSIMVGVPAAFGLSRFSIKGKEGIMLFVLSVRFMPYIIFALPLFFIMSRLGVIGTYGGLIFVYIIISLPLIIWLMKAFFDSVPYSVDEAAALDGASQFRIFWQIVLPCSLPGLATVTILSLIFAWNEYLFALILSGRDAQTLTVGLTRFLGGMETAVRWGMLSAWSITIITPVVLMALLVNRQLRKGFTGMVED